MKLFIVLLLSMPTLSISQVVEPYESYEDNTYFYLGQGMEMRGTLDSNKKIDVFMALQPTTDFNSRVGMIYKFANKPNWHLGIGGGISLVEHEFDAIEKPPGDVQGYSSTSPSELAPFLQFDAAYDIFFVEVFYAYTSFDVTRNRIVSIGSHCPGILCPDTLFPGSFPEGSIPLPKETETRKDHDDGPGWAAFIGFRFPLGK